jgi:hypothetical protein
MRSAPLALTSTPLKQQLFLFPKLDLLAEELRVARVFCQKRNYGGWVLGFFWNSFVVDAPQSQVLAIVRQFPNDVSIFAIARIEVLDSRERCFRDLGVVSAKEIAVVINDVDAVVEAPQFQLFLAISGRPVAKQSFLHLSGRSRCDWDVILASTESQSAKTNRYADCSQPSEIR